MTGPAFFDGPHTRTVTDLETGRQHAVTFDVFIVTRDEDFGPVLRSAAQARHHSILFAASRFLRKGTPADPVWAAADEYRATIPADERY